MAKQIRKSVESEAETKKSTVLNADMFGNRLKIPQHIQSELDKKGLVGRFLSTKKLQESGGFHPMGWTPYLLESPIENPLTGTVDKVHRVGDLVLGVKPKEQHAQHLQYLKQKAESQSMQHKRNIKEIRDRIREGRADKHISLIEGYEENDGDDDE